MSSRYSSAAPTTQDSTISALISDLSADDAAARKNAAQQLLDKGDSARSAIEEATHNDDPEIRAQSRQILMKLPWWRPEDPPEVKEILSHYIDYAVAPQDIPGLPPGVIVIGPPPKQVVPVENPTDANRCEAVDALASLEGGKGLDALIRLFGEDPSDKVRWTIVHALRTCDDGTRLAKFRTENPPPETDGPLIALDAFAWLAADSPKAEPLLQKAVEADISSPPRDDGELNFEVNLLVDLQTTSRHFDAAADVLRKSLKHNPPTDARGLPLPLLKLFALHANHGPLAGFDDDRKLAGDYLSSPKIQYALAHLAARQNQTDAAAAARKDAFNANSNSRTGRYETAKYLSENGWNDDAEAEFKEYLAMTSPNNPAMDESSDVNAHFALAELAARRGDDFDAAEQKKAAMLILGGGTQPFLITTDALGREQPVTEDQIWAEIHWRYLKAAQSRKDDAAIDNELKEILRLNPTDVDIAIDAVPILKERKETDAAADLFKLAYKSQRAKLDADPNNAGLKNGLAWLDAKCDENIDEAFKLATAAVAADPNSAAMTDTLAEVNFHLGHADKAVELETRALQLEPGDKFMTGQLARFKAGMQPNRP